MALVRRHRLPLAIALALVLAGFAVAWATSGGIRNGLAAASAADPGQSLMAGVAFAASLAATAFAWRVSFAALGARVGRLDACAWYVSGSLVNTISPARLGEGVRAALFARTLPSRDGRVLAAAGAVGAMAASRAIANAVLIAVAAGFGIVPLWPVLAVGGVVGGVIALGLALGRRGGRLGCLAAALGTLVRTPRLAASLLGWAVVAVAARVFAAAAVASALGVTHPLLAALAVTAALDVATALPLTPGGVGITSGAVSLALASRGVGFSSALAAGVVFHVVETLATLGFAGLALPAARWWPATRVPVPAPALELG